MDSEFFSDGDHSGNTDGSACVRSHMWLVRDDRIWDMGPAEVDTDADGTLDSLTRNGPDGMTIYTDSDHDGQVDVITELHADGSVDSLRLTDDGTWARTSSGRLA